MSVVRLKTHPESLPSAVRAGDAEAVQRFLVEGAPAEQTVFHTNEGWSLLAVAIDLGHAAIVRLLLDAGASANPHAASETEGVVRVGPFQAAISADNRAGFQDLLARCPQALEPDFTPTGMKSDPVNHRPSGLWQALLRKHEHWLVELIQERRRLRPDAPLETAPVVKALSEHTGIRLSTLEALSAVMAAPAEFAEDLAASATYSAYLKGSLANHQTGGFANRVGLWALRQGATLEGRRQKHHASQKSRPSSALAHIVALDSASVPALKAWLGKRAAACPLNELDTAVRSATVHIQPAAYTLLMEARQRRADGALPLTPESESRPPGRVPSDHSWLRTTLDRLLARAAGQDHSQKQAAAFLTAFRAHPVAVDEPGARPYHALLQTASASPVPLTTLQQDLVETLCMDWLKAGLVPDKDERVLLRCVSPRAFALMEDSELARELPGAPARVSPLSRLRL